MTTLPTFECYQGDDLRIDIEVDWYSGNAVDLTAAHLQATARAIPGGVAQWTKKNTAAGGSDSEIIVTDASGGMVSVLATPTDLSAMAIGTYDLDLVGTLGTGKTYTLAHVRLRVLERPTVGVPS